MMKNIMLPFAVMGEAMNLDLDCGCGSERRENGKKDKVFKCQLSTLRIRISVLTWSVNCKKNK